MDRTKTGIQGLDKALKGGIPEGNLVLISGGAGTGKSTLCLQFLVNGAQLFGEKGLFVSTEQNQAELCKHAERFGWDLRGLLEKQQIKLVYFDITSGDDFLQKLDVLIKEFKPKRITVDSMTTLTDALIIGGLGEKGAFSLVQIAETVSPIPRTEQIVSKSILYKLITELKKHDVTTLLTSELYEEVTRLSADGISEFICDGVITMHYLGIAGADTRSLRVRKIRYSDHSKSYLPYEILTDKGIVVHEEEAMDVLMK